MLRRLVEHRADRRRSVIVLLDDVDLLPMTGDVLLRRLACAWGSETQIRDQANPTYDAPMLFLLYLALATPLAEARDPMPVSPRDVRRRDLLGGLIHDYHGAAA